jgi:DNA-binding response OmpR family regulator
MTGELILLVDDEPHIIELARMYLEREGFRTVGVGDGKSALDAVRRLGPAAVVLDLMLPELTGMEVCRRLRAEDNRIPILMLSAKDEDLDKILGLEIGADDYLTKPFNPRELVARIRALLRRTSRAAETGPEVIHLGDLVIDPGGREVKAAGQSLDLRAQEFELLYTFARHPGIVLTREKLLDLAWGYDYAGKTRTVDVHVGHIRKKIAGSSAAIETVTGIGYKLVVTD